MRLKIPAKALLFGEYGVLAGGRALVRLLPHLFFDIEINIKKRSEHIKNSASNTSTYVYVKSDFFKQGFCEFSLNAQTINRIDASEQNPEQKFFENILMPWSDELKNHDMMICIHDSFAPDLGFGSSSSILTALSYTLFVHFYDSKPQITDENLWEKVRTSLSYTQGTASGYDVGVQLAHVIANMTNKKDTDILQTSFWIYKNQSHTIVPHIEQWHAFDNTSNLNWLGSFVKTNIYSDTKKVLKKFSTLSEHEKVFFMTEHAKIAEEFLNSPNQDTLIKCMNRSVALAKKQGIYCETDMTKELILKNIPFKTMGSGCGDCIWVAHNTL